MERVTDKKVIEFAAAMQRQGLDVGLDGQYGKFRVTNKEGSKNLSPRATNREVLDWLDAYRLGHDDAIREFRKALIHAVRELTGG